MCRPYCILAVAVALFLAAPDLIGGDDTLDWLIQKHATTAPATGPVETTGPATRKSPLVRQADGTPSVTGTITLSNAREITGSITTTPGKPLRLWVEQQHEYVDLQLSEIVSMTANVLWERDEKEWHFIASGSDVKEYTGRTYPSRETSYTITLADGRRLTGGVVAPLYVRSSEGERMLVLNKRSKGPVGATLEDLVFVKNVRISGQSTP